MAICVGADIADRIVKEIRKSGFPLEVYCINVCSKKNTGRMPDIRYMYEGKLKEIDLWAFFEEINLEPKEGENLQHTSTDMIIECKKSRYPWVFFSSSSYKPRDVFDFTNYASEFDSYFVRKNAHRLLDQIYGNLRENHYKYTKDVPYCISYFEAFKKPDAPSGIYDAIDSVLSFLDYRRKIRDPEDPGCYTEFLFPVVVLEGALFEAEVERDEINVRERNHIQLRMDYKDDIYIVDIVKKEYFEKYVDMIERDHLDFVESINKIRFSKTYKSKLRTAIEKEDKAARNIPLVEMIQSEEDQVF